MIILKQILAIAAAQQVITVVSVQGIVAGKRSLSAIDGQVHCLAPHRGEQLSRREAQTLTQLMDLSDNDLLDVLLARKPASDFGDAYAMPDMAQLVRMMQAKH